MEEVYTRRIGNEEGGEKLKGSKETLLGVRRGKEERRRRGKQIGGGGTKVKASVSNSVFTGRDRKTVEIVVATLVLRVLICIPLRPTCALNFSTLTAESTRNVKPCALSTSIEI